MSRLQSSEPGSGGDGYPLRDEATEHWPPPATPVETSREEIYAEPPPPERRRFVPRRTPWPWLLAVVLLLGGLGVGYAVTRPSPSTHAGAPSQAAASPVPTPAPSTPTVAAQQPPPPPPTTAPAPAPPPPPKLVAVPDVTGIQGLVAVHTLQGDHLIASIRYVPSTEPARRVVSQWPPAGREVKPGIVVRLNLSQGLRKKAYGGG